MIMNDIFMRNVLKETACTEYILQVIMDMKELKVIDQTLQKNYKYLQGRSAILDCVARDAENHHFNVEIQGENDAMGESIGYKQVKQVFNTQQLKSQIRILSSRASILPAVT